MNATFPVNPAKKLPLQEVDSPECPEALELVRQRRPFRCRLRDWGVLAWDIPYLQKRVGHVERKVKRVSDGEHITISTADLLDVIRQDPGWKSKFVPLDSAFPIHLRLPGYRTLLEDLRIPSYVHGDLDLAVMMRDSRASEDGGFYDTPCHYEPNVQPAIYVQTSGRKHLWLFAPSEGPYLGVESFMHEPPYLSNGAEACAFPDRYPQLAKATCYEAVLEPGDFVYWPEFWFHWFVHYQEFQLNIRIDWTELTFELNPMSASWAYNNALAKVLGGFANLAEAFATMPPETRALLVGIEQALINDPLVLHPRWMSAARRMTGFRVDQTAYKPPTPPKSGG
jgi:hypothetical protein